MDTYFTSMDFELNSMSHPLVPHVNSPEDIKNMFDEITYYKGGSILRMARYILGENTFRNGINVTMKSF